MAAPERPDADLMDMLPGLDTQAGPAARVDAGHASSMVTAALDDVLGPALADGGVMAPEEPATVTKPPRRRYASVAVLVLGLAGTTAAAAAVYVAVTDEAAPEQVPERAPRRSIPTPQPPPPLEEEPEPETTAVAPEGEGEIEEPAEEPERVRRPRRAAPADMLAHANELRASRRWRAAERSYRHVYQSHPGTHEAYAAIVAAASLRLDHLRDPRAALRLYRRALAARPSGPLAEEARYGMASAHRRLGNREAELEALQRFITQHPTSLRSNRANARIHELTTSQ